MSSRDLEYFRDRQLRHKVVVYDGSCYSYAGAVYIKENIKDMIIWIENESFKPKEQWNANYKSWSPHIRKRNRNSSLVFSFSNPAMALAFKMKFC